MSEAGVDTPVRHIGIPQRFLAHASRSEVLEELGMDTDTVAAQAVTWADEIASR